MTIKEMKTLLKEKLDTKRYRHSVGVAKAAGLLAVLYGVNRRQAYIAGLLHDCAKNYTLKDLLNTCEKFSLPLDSVTLSAPSIIHSYVGAYVAKSEFFIRDSEILGAIYYHTVAKEDMTLLMQIVYVADKIDPNRKSDEADRIFKIAKNDLEEGLLASLDSSIKYILNKGLLIHPDTVLARNFYIMRKMRKAKKDGI